MSTTHLPGAGPKESQRWQRRGKGQKLGPISERNFIYIDLKVFAFIHIKTIVELKMQQQGKNNLRLGKRYPKRQVQTGGII